jgi:anthranilate phosphoribosyltransferase
MIRDAIGKLTEGLSLGSAEAEAAMGEIMDGAAGPCLVAAYLAALRTKGESEDEIEGSARALRRRCLPVRPKRTDCVDTCGTGGDRSGSFNISSAASILAAAAGAAVVKHGNRAVSGSCGSADFFEALGVSLDSSPRDVEESVDRHGFGFCFAPAFHPGLKHAGPVRREIGFATIFNILGPLANPALVRRQVLGIFAPRWILPLARVLTRLDCDRALVVHGESLDEISPWGTTRAALVENGKVRALEITPRDASLDPIRPGDVAGLGAAGNAGRFERILRGHRDPLRVALVLNAAAALWVSGAAENLRQGAALAAEVIDSGAARRKLEELRS